MGEAAFLQAACLDVSWAGLLSAEAGERRQASTRRIRTQQHRTTDTTRHRLIILNAKRRPCSSLQKEISWYTLDEDKRGGGQRIGLGSEGVGSRTGR